MDYAFSNCTGLTSVTINTAGWYEFPNWNWIYEGAFSGCTGLTELDLTAFGSLSIECKAFSGCTGLKSVAFPDNMDWLGGFEGCTGLTSISLPDRLEECYPDVFKDCTGLTSIVVPESVIKIGKGAFSGTSISSLTIPESVVALGGFENCHYLTTVSLSKGLKELCPNAFSGCTSLTSIDIPEGVSEIGDSVFRNCPSLTSVTLPSTLIAIGKGAFVGNSGLTTIVIPEGVREIGDSAFSNCPSLTSVTLPSTLTAIGKGAFAGNSGMTTIIIPEGIREIGDSAFSNCPSLISVTLPSTLTSVGVGAFIGCPNLACITMAEGTTEIPAGAFSNCTSLTSVMLPASVFKIGNDAFSGCHGLTTVSIPGTVTTIGNGAFNDCQNLKTLNIESSATPLAFGTGDDADLAAPFAGSPLETLYMGRNLEWAVPQDNAYTPFGTQTSLRSVTFGPDADRIKESTFAGCTSLGENLTIPGTVRYIGASAFDGCTGIKSLSFESGENDLELAFGGCFKGCPVDSIYLDRKISSGADSQSAGFPICDPTNLKTVIFGENITEVPASAFSGCTGLESIDLVPNLTTIESSAFSGCTGLKSLDFGANLTTIGSLAFSGCTGLSCIVIPPTIDSVGTDAFKGCTGLLKSAYPDKFQKPISNGYAIAYPSESYLFTDDGCIYNTDKTMLYFVPMNAGRTFELEGSVKYLNGPAFYGCYGIEELVVKEGAEDIVFDSPGVSLPYTIGSLYMGRNIINDDYNCTGPFTPGCIKEVTISDNVTTIGVRLFYQCNFRTIDIPESVRKIEPMAFEGSVLNEIVIPNTVESIGNAAFRNCYRLSYVRLPETLTEISSQLFYNCQCLNDIVFPETVTIIGNYAFGINENIPRVESLESIKLPHDLKVIGLGAFKGAWLEEISLPEGLEIIYDGAFSGCALKKVTIPGSLREIWPEVFLQNEFPIDLVIKEGNPLYIDPSAFKGAEISSVEINRPIINDSFTLSEKLALKSATFGDKVLSINPYMFNDCKNLASVTLSKGLETIRRCAFIGCDALVEISIPESVTTIEEFAFRDCSSLQSIEIPNGIEILASSVFSGCKALKNVSLPASLTAISSSAFWNCESLEYLSIPSEVRTIGSTAFYKTGLTEIRLPGKMEKIDAKAFAGCKNLTKVYSLNPVPPLIESSTFDEVTEANATLMMPEDARMYYAVDHIWREFKNISGYSNIMEALPEATYGDGDINLDDYAPDGFRFVYTADNDDVVTIQGSMMRITGAGETTITATTADGLDSGVTGLVRRFVVNKASLTVSVNDMTIMEGEELPPFEYTAEGFVNDDTIDDIEQMPTPECAYTVTSPAGVYPVRLVGGRDRNYSFITEDAELTVTENVGIDSIEADRLSGTVEVYNLNGVLLYHGPFGEARLQQGIYMVRRGNVTSKLYVK